MLGGQLNSEKSDAENVKKYLFRARYSATSYHLLTENEVITEKSQNEALFYIYDWNYENGTWPLSPLFHLDSTTP